MSNKKLHILRYGTVADSEYLKKSLKSYDYLAINGNTAAYVSSAIAKFVVNNFFSNKNKGYFIDPLTYAFQDKLDNIYSTNKNGEQTIKKSISKLIDAYENPINCVKNRKPVRPKDFVDDEICLSFANRVLNFQNDLVSNYVEENNLLEYIEYVNKKEITPLKPKFLIAPYFYLDNNDAEMLDWLNTNIKLSNLSVDICNEKDNDVFCQITIDRNILCDKELIEKIGNAYRNVNCTGYTIWINGLSEQTSSKEELLGYVKLLKILKDKPVYDMYGGYFSILLLNNDISLLEGVSHGLEYGESREVFPVGGGIPTPKYYFKPIHQRIDFTKAFYLLEHRKIINPSLINLGKSNSYYNEICNCNNCKNLLKDTMKNFIKYECNEFYEIKINGNIQRRKKPNKETKENCLYHYLLCKKQEYDDTKTKSIKTLLIDLEDQYNNYNNCQNIKFGELDYMKIWIDVINSIKN